MISDKLELVLSRLLAKHHFFAVLLSSLCKLHEVPADDRRIPTAGTDGKSIWVNSGFIASMPLPQVLFLLCHEILHVMLRSMPVAKVYFDSNTGPDGSLLDQRIMNQAMDYEINAYLDNAGIGQFIPGGCLDTQRFPFGMPFREIYLELIKDAQKGGQGQGDGEGKGKPGAQGQGNSTTAGGDPYDEHIMPENVEVDAAAEEDTIRRAVKNAVAAAKAAGTLPGGMERLFDEICSPQVNWRDEIRRDITATQGRDAYSFRKPHRRKLAMPPHVYMPSSTGHRAGTIVVGGDTSGSISDEWKLFFGEMQGIHEELNPAGMYITSCDAKCYDLVHVEASEEIGAYKPIGGGGTDMTQIFHRIEEEGIAPDAVVILTDGYTPFGSEPPYKVIWCITTDVVAPFGKTIRLK